MNIKPIKSEEEYVEAVKRLETIFDAKKGSVEGEELEILGALIDQYEKQKFPIDFPK